MRLLAGETSYAEPPTAAIPDGTVLLCCARPRSTAPIVLDL